MTPEPTPDVRQALEDHVRIWQVDPVGHTDTLADVARSVAPESELPALAALRDADSMSRTRLAGLVADLADQLGLTALSGVVAQDVAVEAMARRLLADEVTPRELTYWVTRVVGLRGGPASQRFLALEQEYCDRLGEETADLDARVNGTAQDVVTAGGDGPVDADRPGLLARLRGRAGRRSGR